MARLLIIINSDLPPEQVREALIDFSPRRPELWPGINASMYEVVELGDTWAVVREGTVGAVWSVERYDWSSPNRVVWTVQESGFSRPGDYVAASILSRAGGGSRIELEWEKHGTHLTSRLIVGLIALLRGFPVKRSFQVGLRAIAASMVSGATGVPPLK